MGEIGAPVFQAVTEYATEPLRDATHILREARLVKSPEMLEYSRASARLADEAYELLKEMAQPGARDYEIYGAVKDHLFKNGSEYSLEVIDAEGAKMNFTWAPTGEVLEEGGHLFMEITPAVGGVYAQLPFCLPIGQMTDKVQDLREAWLEGFTAGEAMLAPGTLVSELSKTMKEAINARGYLTPFAQGHAIGLDVVDGWAIGDNTDVVLQPGMTLAVHPAAVDELGGDAFTCGYTYLITESGAERLSSLDFTH
jgi:Xaa-Pro aminopeptidase